MKIALVAPLCESVPPKLYGGTERVVAYLADELTALGQEVTLFASKDSCTRARLIGCRDQAIRLDPYPLKSDVAAHLGMLESVRDRLGEFDLLHFHTELLHCPLFQDVADRTLTTLHGRLDVKDLIPFYQRWQDFPLVSISDNQRTPLAFANWVATVYHGLPLNLYRPPANPTKDYLAFLGRFSPEKRPDLAIRIALKFGIPIKLAAKVEDQDLRYFRQEVEPLLQDPLVEYVGEVNDQDKSEFLGNALALIFPVHWPEPFGMVMIEAMACGTPVIAFPFGSVPEIVDVGITGIVVEDEAQALSAITQVAALDRKRIRDVFEQRFSVSAMAQKYLYLYQSQLDKLQSPRLVESWA